MGWSTKRPRRSGSEVCPGRFCILPSQDHAPSSRTASRRTASRVGIAIARIADQTEAVVISGNAIGGDADPATDLKKAPARRVIGPRRFITTDGGCRPSRAELQSAASERSAFMSEQESCAECAGGDSTAQKSTHASDSTQAMTQGRALPMAGLRSLLTGSAHCGGP